MGHTLHLQHQRRKRQQKRAARQYKSAVAYSPAGETRTFSLRTVLTVTTGRLLTEPKGENDNGIGDLYELLGWMTMDSPFTHQLGRFADECKPILYRLFPELALGEACLPKLDEWLGKSPTCPQEGIKMWITQLRMMFPEIKLEYAIPQFPIEHATKDPVAELMEIAPNAQVVTVAPPQPEVWPDHI